MSVLFNVHVYIDNALALNISAPSDYTIRDSIAYVICMLELKDDIDRVRANLRPRKFVGTELFDVPFTATWQSAAMTLLADCNPSDAQQDFVLDIYTQQTHRLSFVTTRLDTCMWRPNASRLQSYGVGTLAYALMVKLFVLLCWMGHGIFRVAFRIATSTIFIAIVSFILGYIYCGYDTTRFGFVPAASFTALRHVEAWIRIQDWEIRNAWKKIKRNPLVSSYGTMSQVRK